MITFSDFMEDGLRKQSFYDEAEDRLIHNVIQDVEPILNINKDNRDQCDGTFYNGNRVEKQRLYCRVPSVTVHKWINEGKIPQNYTIPELLKIVNTEAPYLKTCNFHHEGIIK